VVEKQRDKLGHTRWERRAEAMFASWSKNPDLAVNDADEFIKLLREHSENFTPLLQHALDSFALVGKPNPFMLPHQHEFNRLNLSYVVMSKRKLIQLVDEKHVDGWDDPRMPTLVGLRRRGYTPQSIQLFMERVGVTKSLQWIDYAMLEQALRDDLDARAPRATAVLRPIRLVIDNYPADKAEDAVIPVHPQKPEMGVRRIPFGRELWIEADDFMENAPADYFRLSLGKSGAPGNPVRLRFAYVVRATSVEKDATGNITAVHAEYLPETRSGSPGQNSVKTKTAIHWLPVSAAVAAEVRLYDRLFTEAQPDASERNFLDLLNADSKTVLTSFVEASLASARPDDKFQFERNGYFVADRKDHTAEGPVFNLAVSLRDSFAK
jgi:glutaminyl-tRNA synthetase